MHKGLDGNAEGAQSSHGFEAQGGHAVNVNNFVRAFVAAGAFAALTGITESAHATPSSLTCTVTNVAWATGNSGTVQIYCSGTGYWAFGDNGGDADCPAPNLDARKAWLSLAQAALLSGKTLYIEFTAGGTGTGQCVMGPAISFVRLP
jgi:hypothetical protein